MTAPLTRAEAKAADIKRYGPTSTCKHGHFVERLTINGSCVECSRLKRIALYKADPEADLARQKVYRQSRPGYADARRDARNKANPLAHQKMKIQSEDLALRSTAFTEGTSKYTSPRPCQKCSTAIRFSHDGKCIECNRISCAARHQRRLFSSPLKMERITAKKIAAVERAERKEKITQAASVIRAARQEAIASGALTYIGGGVSKGSPGPALHQSRHLRCLRERIGYIHRKERVRQNIHAKK